jgi:hypothetical protein
MATETLKPKTQRARRTTLADRSPLHVTNKDPQREYRIVNDTGDRISMFIERGWRIEVDPNMKVGERRLGTPSKEGSPQQVSVGGAQKAYVMSIEKEYYDEDFKAKQDDVDETERIIKEKALDGTYGKLEINRK